MRPRTFVAIAAAAVLALLAQVSVAAAATFTVTTTADSGPGSLRQALTDVSADGTDHTIAFAIPGPGPHVIAPASALPFVNRDGTTIDGCTQPGADCTGRPLALTVRLEGQGFALSGAYGVTIRGLSFTGAGTGVTNNRVVRSGQFVLSRDLTVEKNFFGIAPDGSLAGIGRALQLQPGQRGLSEDSLRILDNVIGGNGSAQPAIDLRATGFQVPHPIQGLRIAGNVIGLDPTGTEARPNANDGIVLAWSAGAQIVGNIVASSPGVGIRHLGRTQAIPGSDPAVDPGLLLQGNVVRDNAGGGIVLAPNPATPISINADPNTGPIQVVGNTVEGNGAAGITAMEATGTLRPNLQIGGTGAGEGNVITGNDGPGVAVGADTADTSVGVTVRGNSIYGNTGPRIDLGSDGRTDNGPAGTVRTGPNQLVNFPVITEVGHGSVIVAGTYAGAPSADVTLDFYASATTDGPQTWVGGTTLTTGADGTAVYRAEFQPDVPAGWFISATATDPDGSTSEFGEATVVPPAPPPAPPVTSPPPAGAPTPPPSPSPSSQRKPKLRVSQTFDRATLRAGGTVTYAIQVRNGSGRAVDDVRVCATLPAGLAALSARPAARLSQGRRCWSVRTLAAGQARTFRLVLRALPGTRGTKVNRAVASSPEARTGRAVRAIRVLPVQVAPGGVTG